MKRWPFAVAVAVLVALFFFWPRSTATPPASVAVPAEPAHVEAPVAAAAARPSPPPAAVPAASAPRTTDTAPDASTASGTQALFGPLVALGQGYAFSEALQKNAQNAEKYVDKLCDDSRKLREQGPMKTPQGTERDAAEFMAPLIDYEKPLDQPPGKLHLSDELKEHLAAGAGTDWGTKITPADLAALDFSWMAALAQFDHWSLLSAGRLKDYKSDDFFSTPIPNYISLQQWSKLRFALARRRKDFGAASREVRHLADLTRTQGILIAEAIAVAIYRIDATARDAAIAAGGGVSDWPPLDRDLLDLQRNVAFASMYFTYPGVKPETLRRAMGCVPLPCVALSEGAGANRAFGSYAADNLAAVREIAAKEHCEQALIDRGLESRELSPAETMNQLGDDLDAQIPKRLGAQK